MTVALISPRAEDPTTTTEPVPTNGYARIRLSRDGEVNGQWVESAWSQPVYFAGAALEFNLDPTTIPYELYYQFKDGTGTLVKRTRFAIITDEASPTPWHEFVQVTGPDASPVLTSEVEARLTALESSVGGISGGASNLASITDMTAYMRTVNAETSAADARDNLGAAAAAATLNLTGNQTKSSGVLTFAESPIVPTPTTGTQAATKAYVDSTSAAGTPDADGSTKGKVQLTNHLGGTAGAPTVPGLATLQSQIDALTTLVGTLQDSVDGLSQGVLWVDETSPGVYPNRAVTEQKTVWAGSVAPVFTGTTTSGTTAVPDLDVWIRTA